MIELSYEMPFRPSEEIVREPVGTVVLYRCALCGKRHRAAEGIRPMTTDGRVQFAAGQCTGASYETKAWGS